MACDDLESGLTGSNPAGALGAAARMAGGVAAASRMAGSGICRAFSFPAGTPPVNTGIQTFAADAMATFAGDALVTF